MSEPPPASCAVCGKKQSLLLCSACRVIHYCSSDHQIKHRPGHKAACNTIKKAKQLVETEEARLRKTELDCAVALSFATYKYAKSLYTARALLFQALTSIDTKASLQAQLDDLHRLFLLGPHHVLFARYYLPALMIRLGKDQECYDLIKWFRAAIDIPDEDWATETSLGVTVKDADPFQPDRIAIGGQSELDLKIHQALVKVRLCLDVEALHSLSEAIKPYVLQTSIIASKPEIVEANDHKADGTALIGILLVQLSFLMLMVHSENPHFWAALTSPSALDYSKQRLQMDSCIDKSWKSNSPEMAEALVKMNIDAWLSTPRALDFVREKWGTILRNNEKHGIPMPRDPFSNPMPGNCPAM
ncbi:hypothetical protein N7509_000817 [Penicillium cosmopolitanum]|uniref:MYND-type domain-containing protein n=1 Tax=Penicillium cosmopolitanum TaxID=1131564 RepID=A0A9W9WAZ3_9EURO|nr:uncharacterized protein N7509_000817 [Penicillium cosmopolitanum]KAJ5414190.1 hypothetical protein N7509_000817 [Penicillium cosmopolitanum]